VVIAAEVREPFRFRRVAMRLFCYFSDWASRRRMKNNNLGSRREATCSRDHDWIPVIAVPARNEARRLPGLLRALSKQTWLAVKGRQLRITLCLNNCTDRSKEAVARASSFHQNLLLDIVKVAFPASDAHVGSARRLAADSALAKIPDLSRCVLFTTDADAEPEATWIDANLRAIDAGADMVGGLIIGDEAEETQFSTRFLRRVALQLQYARLADKYAALIDPLPYDPWPRHVDHTGASIAVRSDVYSAVGGFPAIRFREDLAFASRVRAAGFRLRHSLEARVRVSVRLQGRAPGGMADCLRLWIKADSEGEPHLVENPHDVTKRLLKRNGLRALGCLDRDAFERATTRIYGSGTPCIMPHSRRIPAIIEALAPDEPDAVGSVPIELAMAQMKRMIADVDSIKIA
jgi:Glycosyl transferase family 2